MRVPILLYHWFRDAGSPPGLRPELGMEPDDFGRQMRRLAEDATRVASLKEVVRALRDAATLSPRPVVLTFDDAYEDFRTHALEILVGLHLPATVFAVAGRVGGTNDWDREAGEPPRRLLDWRGLRELADAGIEIGSHSVTHPDLRTLSDPDLREECHASRKRIEDRLGCAVRHFAYPFGRYDDRVKAAVREAGYDAACAVLLRPWDMLRSESFALMRVIIHATKGLDNFRRRVRLAAPRHRVR